MQEKKETNVTFRSDRLAELLHKKKLSPMAFSKALGISHVAVGNYLNEGRRPRTEILAQIAKFFSVPMDYFVEDFVPAREVGTPPSLMKDEDIRKTGEELAEIKEVDPQGYGTFRRMISIHYGNVKRKPASSTPASGQEVAPASASTAARRELQESQHSPEADEPSAHKRGRGRGAGRGTKKPPGTQGEPPK